MKHVIIIPIYNDWKSLNKLLLKLDHSLKNEKKIKNEILLVNDDSSKKLNLKKKKFKVIKRIKVIFLKKNLGSQKAIAIGLSYLKKLKENFLKKNGLQKKIF